MNYNFSKLQKLFCLFFGLGFLLVVLGDIIFSDFLCVKIIGMNSSTAMKMKNSSFWLITVSILSVILLVCYTVLGLKKKPDDVPLEQFADSAYYLGFLFTLISLIFALHNVEIEGNMKWGVIGNVIEKNSIALLTTVAGLFIRVFLVQFQSSADQEREKILKDFFENLKKLNESIQRLNNELNSFIIESVTKAKEKKDSWIESIESIERKIKELFENSIKELEQLFENSIKELEQNFNKLNERINNSAAQARKTETSWTSFTSIISSTQATMKLYNTEMINANDRIKTSYKEMDNANVRIKTSCTKMDKFNQVMETGRNTLNEYEQYHKEYQEQLIKSQTETKKLNDEAQQDLETLRRHMIESAKLLQKSIEQAIKVSENKDSSQ